MARSAYIVDLPPAERIQALQQAKVILSWGLPREIVAEMKNVRLWQLLSAGVKGKPVVITHVYEDSSMPLEWSHQSRDFLLRHGVNMDYHNFHMGHPIIEESLAAVRGWLDRQVAQR